MNGPHDIGGQHGFGPVLAEDETERFHADWEKRVLGLTLASAALGYWNIDASRHARESLPHAIYYNASYYEIWLRALENLLKQAGELSPTELTTGEMQIKGNRAERCMPAEAVPNVLAAGGPTDRPGPAARFQLGDKVRTLNHQPAHHTRLPGYARGRVGKVITIHGAHVFPDTNAQFQGEQPAPLYTIRFEATELYGPDVDPTLSVSIEAWEPYLEPA